VRGGKEKRTMDHKAREAGTEVKKRVWLEMKREDLEGVSELSPERRE